MDYLKLLEHSFEVCKGYNEVESRLEFIGINVFDFTTYDGEMDNLFGSKALEVCKAINSKQTFEYQKDPENYKWYLIMVNMPFFEKKLEWGTSIRGAWWDLYGDAEFVLSSCGMYVGEEQLLEIRFNSEQWGLFVDAMADFAAVEDET